MADTGRMGFATVDELDKYLSNYPLIDGLVRQVLTMYANAIRYGQIRVTGRCNIDKEPIHYNIYFTWYKWRRAIWVNLRSFPPETLMPQYAQYSIIGIHIAIKEENAWRILFPDRVMRFDDLKLRHTLKKQHIICPTDATLDRILDQWDCIVLVNTTTGVYLCSPLGYHKVPIFVNTVYQALKELHIRIPRDSSKRTWDNMQNYWVMASLAKL